MEKLLKSSNTVYVGNLNYKTTEEDIKRIFEYYGKVDSVHFVKDETGKKNKGIAFIKMPKTEQAIRAVEKMNAKTLDGRTIKVSLANDRFAALKKTELKSDEEKPKKLRAPVKRKTRGLKVLLDLKADKFKQKKNANKYSSR